MGTSTFPAGSPSLRRVRIARVVAPAGRHRSVRPAAAMDLEAITLPAPCFCRSVGPGVCLLSRGARDDVGAQLPALAPGAGAGTVQWRASTRSEGRGQEGHIGSRKGGNPSPTRSPNAPSPPARSPRNHLPATRRVLIDAGDGPPMEAAVRRQAGRGSMAADTARDDQRTPSSVQWLGVLSAAWIGQFEPTYRSAGAGPGIGVALRGRSNRAMQLSR